jgi:hypothetical protein
MNYNFKFVNKKKKKKEKYQRKMRYRGKNTKSLKSKIIYLNNFIILKYNKSN